VVQFSNGRSIRRRRADARRVEILRAAARTFRARGFAASGMRDIAVAADLSPANLYHYFRGKNELLFFCQNRTLDQLLQALAAARRAGRPLVDRLHDLAATHVFCLIDEVEGSAAHLEVAALPPRLRAAILAKRDRYERGVRALVSDGIRRRELQPADATIATRAFLGSLNWTAHWFRPEGPQSPVAIAEQVAAFAVAGLSGAARAARKLKSGVRKPKYAKRPHHADGQRRSDRGRLRAVQDAPRGAA
jgi:AcrR family transcriptional regulator